MKKWLISLMSVALVLSATGCPIDGKENVSQSKFALTGSSCGATATPILGAGSLNLGTAVVSNTGTDLTINISGNDLDGWKINELFIYAGTGGLPTDPVGGWVDFQLFPVKESHYPGIDSKQVTFTLDQLYTGDACGVSLNIGVFMWASQTDALGNVTSTQAGWAYNVDYIGSTCPCEGVTFDYTVCCTPEDSAGCTLTQGYWKNHNSFATKRPLMKDWPAPMDESAQLCAADSRTMLELLQANPAGGDAYLILAHQYIAAQLNIASGATTTPEVDQALDSAIDLINNHCGQFVHASTADGYSMTLAAGILDAYNNGLVSPGHCSTTSVPKAPKIKK